MLKDINMSDDPSFLVEDYIPSEGKTHLGSFTEDRGAFSIIGGRTDETIRDAIIQLALELRDVYAVGPGSLILNSVATETNLGNLLRYGHNLPVFMRHNRHATVAFYVHRARSRVTTFLIAADSHPPENGLNNWWRQVVLPRVEDLLDV